MRFISKLSLACSVAFISGGVAMAADTVTLQLAHDVDLEHSGQKVSEFVANEVAELSGGKMKINIYPSGQMGSTRELMEILPDRGVDMTYISAGGLESFADIYSVLTLPYVFKDKDHYNAVVWGPIGKEIMESTRDKGYVAIGAYAAGSRSFYARDPITAYEDLQGKKLRVPPSPMLVAITEAVGALPTPIAFAESYTAIQQGVVDGAENNIPSFVSTRHFEVAKYFLEDEHSSFPDYLVVSSQTLDALTEEQRGWLLQAAKDAQGYQRELWEQMETENRQTAIEAGVTFTPVDKAPFQAAVKPIVDDFKASHPQYEDLMQRIQDAAN